MDFFQNAKSIRLKSAQDKYLNAGEDAESVTQNRDGSSKSAKWSVEFVQHSDNVIRLKSCYGNYLTASNKPFLLGMAGRKVLQTVPNKLADCGAVEWEVIRENGAVKLKTGSGQFLRANGGLPPWRNSVTHDVPYRSATREWVLWEVHVVEILFTLSPSLKLPPPPSFAVEKSDSFSSESSSSSSLSANSNSSSSWNVYSKDSFPTRSPKGSDGRHIYFHIADNNGEIDEGFEELCITFKGNGVEELRKRLEWELGVEGITVCHRSPLNGLIFPLRLHLPPNNAAMHIVVVPALSHADHFLL